MTDSPTRVTEQQWHHAVPGAAVAVMAAAATLLPGLAVAQDVYLRAGLDLSRPADTPIKLILTQLNRIESKLDRVIESLEKGQREKRKTARSR